MRHRTIFALLSSVAILLLSATPSWAAGVTKSGTTYCSTYGIARSYSTGFTELYPPGSGYRAYNNGSVWTVRTAQASATGGGFWFVETNGSLNSAGTYAYCSSGS